MERHQLARIIATVSCIPGCQKDDAGHVLEMWVCLSSDAHASTGMGHRPAYRARRIVDGTEAWSGRLVLEGKHWVLHSGDDDDPVWPVEFDRLRPGEYLTLHSPDTSSLVFRIINVDYLEETNCRPDLHVR